MTEASCSVTQDRLTDASAAGSPPDANDLAHANGCSACGEHWSLLRCLALQLRDEPPSPSLRAVEAARLGSVAELHAASLAAVRHPPTPASLPPGFGRELGRILGWALLPLPLVLVAYWQLFHYGAAVLGGLVPELFVGAIGTAAALVASSWLGLIYGAIPFAAHRRALAATSEATS